MALIKRVYDLTFKSYNNPTGVPIREAIRYHIEKADDYNETATLSNDTSNKKRCSNFADIHITAAELVQQYGINSVGYNSHCRINNITPYSSKQMSNEEYEEQLNDSISDAFDRECRVCGNTICTCPQTEEEAHQRYLEDLADRDPEYPS